MFNDLELCCLEERTRDGEESVFSELNSGYDIGHQEAKHAYNPQVPNQWVDVPEVDPVPYWLLRRNVPMDDSEPDVKIKTLLRVAVIAVGCEPQSS